MNAAAPERPSHPEMLARLVELNGLTVVDVGCGSGELVRWLRGQGADAVGIECGEVMMRLALEADPEHGDAYRHGVGQDLPLADAVADVVVMSYSLHHVPEDAMAGALREAHRVLRPAGTLYVVEPVAEGAGHEVVRLIDDETEVRAAAQRALAAAAEIGFDIEHDLRYTSRNVIASADAFAARVVGILPTRAARMAENREAFVETFERLALRIDGQYAFDQENIVKVFRKHG